MWQFLEVDFDQPEITINGESYAIKTMRPLGFITHDYSNFRLDAHIWLQTTDAKKSLLPITEAEQLPTPAPNTKSSN